MTVEPPDDNPGEPYLVERDGVLVITPGVPVPPISSEIVRDILEEVRAERMERILPREICGRIDLPDAQQLE